MNKLAVTVAAVSLLAVGAVIGPSILPESVAAKTTPGQKVLTLMSPGTSTQEGLDRVRDIRLNRMPCLTSGDAGCVPGVMVTVEACAVAGAVTECSTVTYPDTEADHAALYERAVQQWKVAKGY